MSNYKQLENPNGLLAIKPDQTDPFQPVNVLGSHELFVNQGLIPQSETYEALVNLRLGIPLAGLQSKRQFKAANVIVKGQLPPEFIRPISTDMEAIIAYNRAFYNQAELLGPNIGITPVSEITELKGQQILPDRNDESLSEGILRNPTIQKTTLDLNDKAKYGELYTKGDLEIKSPESSILNVSGDLLQEFGRQSLSAFEFLKGLIQRGKLQLKGAKFNPQTKYFLKVSNSAGGIGITRFCPEKSAEIIQVIELLLKIRASGGNPQLVFATPLQVDQTPNPDNPTHPEYNSYFSPCMTLRVTATKSTLGQVADQVLAGGTRYIGSYFNQSLQAKFLNNISPHTQLLATKLAEMGYEGYFGTDYIREEQGLKPQESYAAVIDGNARMNGNDASYLVRRAAESANLDIFDTFLSFQVFDGEYASTDELLKQGLGSYAYNPQTQSGIVVSPGFDQETLINSEQQCVACVYLNPTKDKARFDQYFSTL